MLELEAYLAQFGVLPSKEALIIYYEIETQEGNLDQEVCIALTERLPESDRVKVRELPAIETAATIVHAGLWEDTGDTYAVLAHWIESNGYQMTGASRSLILDGELNGDPLMGVCEIILPVAKLLQEQKQA
jgi:effector-binding domain-containing protein